MTASATTTTPLMNRILLALPDYTQYDTHASAMDEEVVFRESLSLLLQDMAGRMMVALENRPGNSEHEALLEDSVEDLAALVTHLERSGNVRLEGPLGRTGRELRDLDHKLIMLLEHAWAAIETVLANDPATAPEAGGRLQIVLQAFGELAESRNQLLGLGWESEFGLHPLTGRRTR